MVGAEKDLQHIREERMKAAAADISGTAEEVRPSPAVKSETPVPPLAHRQHLARLSIHFNQITAISQASLFKKKRRNDTSVSDCLDSQRESCFQSEQHNISLSSELCSEK